MAPGSSRRGARVAALLLLAASSLGLMAAVGELFFRFAIPAASSPYYYMGPDDRILRSDAAERAAGVRTLGSFGRFPSRWQINRAGWNSELEYLPRDEREGRLVAVIGDSYVNALQVDVDRNLAALLQARFAPAVDFYSFGTSGAPLSQYLHASRYVVREFRPDALVFVVVHNDLHESLVSLRRKQFFLQLDETAGGFEEVPPELYRPNRLRRLLSHSAIVRYLWLNSGAWELLNSPPKIAEIPQATPEKIAPAIEWILQRIRDENPELPILFLMDGPRRAIYAGDAQKSPAYWMHEVVAGAASKAGVEFADLTAIFTELHIASGEVFNSYEDYHWNERGHTIAADTVETHLRQLGVLGNRTGR